MLGPYMRYVMFFLIFLSGCTGVAPGIEPVSDFKIERYLGQWHEIARLDHSFERGLSNVTATYSLKDDGGVKVLNKGYSQRLDSWDTAEGKAYFVGQPDKGHLKVSFFGPFYGSYVVFYIDNVDYQYAYVGSYNKEYLWLLSRSKTVDESRKKHFIDMVDSNGYNTENIIWVDQSAVAQGDI